jgi:hypothetical protein
VTKRLPQRHWRSYGNDPLPTPADALAEPFRAFSSWFLRIECDRCGRVQMVNEAHAKWRDRTLRDILARMRHDGCGGLAAKAELLTGIEGVSSRPVRGSCCGVSDRPDGVKPSDVGSRAHPPPRRRWRGPEGGASLRYGCR